MNIDGSLSLSDHFLATVLPNKKNSRLRAQAGAVMKQNSHG